MDAHTNENLLDLINSQCETPVPYREGCIFFPPLEFVFELLGMSCPSSATSKIISPAGQS